MVLNPLAFNHSILKNHIQDGDLVVDATLGNGHDFLFLMKQVGSSGEVLGFDIQEKAIESTQTKVNQHRNPSDYQLIHDSHANLSSYISPETVSAIVFNLGYLPRADKSIITKAPSTLAAIESGLEVLKPGGLMTIMIYWGHPGGQEERLAVEGYLENLSQDLYTILRYQPVNQVNSPPYLIIIEKK